MAGKFTLKETFQFDQPGTLAKPGPIGRIVRLVLGALCLGVAWQLAAHSDVADLLSPSIWLFAALALMLAPYVVNIGFGVTWGAWPRIISVALLFGAAIFSFITVGGVLAYPLWVAIVLWMIYVYAHLGSSFLVSAVLATPGCEMRAIPHLLGLVFKHDAREHYCPGFIDHIDQWERDRTSAMNDAQNGGQPSAAHGANDILDNAGGKLVVYGVPFVALQLAGNLAGFTVATVVPAVAFLLVGVVCICNAWRSRRVHCFFLGPWCLLAGIMTALYSLRIIDFGPDSWQLIVNTGLAGAVALYIASEKIWGKYFGRH